MSFSSSELISLNSTEASLIVSKSSSLCLAKTSLSTFKFNFGSVSWSFFKNSSLAAALSFKSFLTAQIRPEIPTCLIFVKKIAS